MTLHLFLFCACALGLVMADFEPYKLEHAEHHFERFIQEHDRSYAHEYEKQVRFKIFKDNLKKANHLNQKSGRAMFGITPFSDLTQAEFTRDYTGLKASSDGEPIEVFCQFYDSGTLQDNAPKSFDWRDHNVVSPVKSQLTCGSCYAFSSIGTIESQYAIKHKKQVLLSEQQIVDCDMTNGGCCGGYVHRTFQTFINQGGPQTEEDYPYVGTVQKCAFDERMVRVRVTSCLSFNLTCQDELKRVLYYYGPVSIALKASNIKLYTGGVEGIIDDDVCDVGEIDHAVLLVGYGEENGKPYWIVKNSWSGSWGERGYFRIQRGPHAQSCGMMNAYMTLPIIE